MYHEICNKSLGAKHQYCIWQNRASIYPSLMVFNIDSQHACQFGNFHCIQEKALIAVVEQRLRVSVCTWFADPEKHCLV